jgi:hypothetical protein
MAFTARRTKRALAQAMASDPAIGEASIEVAPR